jgi:hypothetical protein
MRSPSVRSISPTRPIVSAVLCGSSAWRKAAKGDRARRVSAVRRLLPPPSIVEHKPVMLASIRWVDVAGRSFRRTWMAHWRRQYVEVLPLVRTKPRGFASSSPTSRHPFSSPLELAGPSRPQCLVGTTAMACHCRWCSRFSRHKCTVGGTGQQQGFSIRYQNPLNGSRGERSFVLFQHALFHRRNHKCHEESFRATSFEKDNSLRIPWDEPSYWTNNRFLLNKISALFHFLSSNISAIASMTSAFSSIVL